MLGNVLEWCADWYGDYPAGAVTDPEGPSSDSSRVLRGGSWVNGPGGLRLAYRPSIRPPFSGIDFGFRLVAPAPR